MKKFITAIVALALIFGSYPVSRVLAGITCPLPFNIQNNTTADATQVMGNYNALAACFASTALAGANNDLTSLAALTSVSSAVNFSNATTSTTTTTGAITVTGGVGIGNNLNVGGTVSGGGLLITGVNPGPTAIIAGTPANLVVGGNITSNAGDITWSGAPTIVQAVGISPQAGAFTSANATINWKPFGKVIIYQMDVTITTAGTASGAILFTLPSGLNPVRNAPITGSQDAPLGGVALSGRIVAGTPGTGNILRYDNTSVIASGAAFHIQGWFENP